MTPMWNPEEMTAGERLAEVSALLAAAYRRHLAARKEPLDRHSEDVSRISQASPSIRLGLLPKQSD